MVQRPRAAEEQPLDGRRKQRIDMEVAQSEQHEAAAPPSPWLDVKAAGVYVGFCEKTIRRACATGGLRCVRMGRSIRIQRAWLDAWLMAQNN